MSACIWVNGNIVFHQTFRWCEWDLVYYTVHAWNEYLWCQSSVCVRCKWFKVFLLVLTFVRSALMHITTATTSKSSIRHVVRDIMWFIMCFRVTILIKRGRLLHLLAFLQTRCPKLTISWGVHVMQVVHVCVCGSEVSSDILAWSPCLTWPTFCCGQYLHTPHFCLWLLH